MMAAEFIFREPRTRPTPEESHELAAQFPLFDSSGFETQLLFITACFLL